MDVKKPEYKVIERTSLAILSQDVAGMMADGWKPQGGVNSTHCENGYRYQQAIIRP